MTPISVFLLFLDLLLLLRRLADDSPFPSTFDHAHSASFSFSLFALLGRPRDRDRDRSFLISFFGVFEILVRAGDRDRERALLGPGLGPSPRVFTCFNAYFPKIYF